MTLLDVPGETSAKAASTFDSSDIPEGV
jgi:hypothetical protein